MGCLSRKLYANPRRLYCAVIPTSIAIRNEKADEGKLHVKRQEMDKGKVRTRFIHLLLALCPHLSLSRVTNIFINRSSTGCRHGETVLLSPRSDRALSISWTSKYVPLSVRAISQSILMPCMFAESAWSGVCNHDKHVAENHVNIFSW
jgi:hypothetical protein